MGKSQGYPTLFQLSIHAQGLLRISLRPREIPSVKRVPGCIVLLGDILRVNTYRFASFFDGVPEIELVEVSKAKVRMACVVERVFPNKLRKLFDGVGVIAGGNE